MGDSGSTTATVGAMSVETNSGASSEEISEALKPSTEEKATPEKEEKTEDEKRSDAASELGKAGGKAAAEKRAAEAKEAKKEAAEEPAEAKPAETPAEETATETDEQKEYKEEGEKRKRDARTRVLEATRKEAEAKRERDQLRAELDALKSFKAGLGRREETESDLPPLPSGKPNPDDYEDDPVGFLDARDAYNRAQWDEENAQKAQMAEHTRQLTTRVDSFRKAVHETGVLDKVDPSIGYATPTFYLPPDVEPTGENWVANHIVLSSEMAPALMLHLSEHLDEFQRIVALSEPLDISAAMGRLEARLEAAATGPTVSSSRPEKAVSKANPPVTPVTGSPYVAEGAAPDASKMDFDTYRKSREKQLNLKR